jgi:DNA-binding CsgD family transcriptional regulator
MITSVDESGRWLELFEELFSAFPLPDNAAEQIARRLSESLRANGTALHWRTRQDGTGLRQWPDMIPETHVRSYQSQPQLLFSDPLWRWFDGTQDPTPTTHDRVSSILSDLHVFAPYREFVNSLGIRHRISIPIELGKDEHIAFIVTRDTNDFTPTDIDLARRLRPILRALHRQSGVLNDVKAGGALVSDCGLTGRELATLALLSRGGTALSIGRRLGISERTVHKHLEHIYKKLGVGDRLAAVDRARLIGVLQVEMSPRA